MSTSPLSYPRSFSLSVRTLLDRLHTESLAQESSIDPATRKHIRQVVKANPEEGRRLEDDLMRDKFIALDNDKSLLVYNLILASGTTSIVEIGTSFGVSTIYLALAALENAQGRGGEVKTAKVIGTEKEDSKAAIARKHWSEAGKAVEDVIELRVGDLLETLRSDVGEVHFVLLDSELFHQHPKILLIETVWAYVALPALELLLPRLRDGAIVVTDNVIKSADDYKDLLKLLRDDNGPFQSVTLPYSGGLEFSVYKPQSA